MPQEMAEKLGLATAEQLSLWPPKIQEIKVTDPTNRMQAPLRGERINILTSFSSFPSISS